MMVQLRSVSFAPFKNTTPTRNISSVVAPRFGDEEQRKVKMNYHYFAKNGGLNSENGFFVRFRRLVGETLYASFTRRSLDFINKEMIEENEAAGLVDWKEEDANNKKNS